MTLHEYVKKNDVTVMGTTDGVLVFSTDPALWRLSDWLVISVCGDYLRMATRPGREQEHCHSCGWIGCTSDCKEWKQ